MSIKFKYFAKTKPFWTQTKNPSKKTNFDQKRSLSFSYLS